MKNVVDTIDRWDEEKTMKTATLLQMQLSILKLIIGIERFDELPCFVRILRDVTRYIDKNTKEDM